MFWRGRLTVQIADYLLVIRQSALESVAESKRSHLGNNFYLTGEQMCHVDIFSEKRLFSPNTFVYFFIDSNLNP